MEADVVALSSFQYVRDVIDSNKVPMLYGRVLLNLAGDKCNMFSNTHPRNGGWDEAVFPNHPSLVKFEKADKWEYLAATVPHACLGWSGLHLKRCKAKYAPGWNDELYLTFERVHVRKALKVYNGGEYPGPDDPLGAECLYEKTLVTETQ
jgi:hypothetical protein